MSSSMLAFNFDLNNLNIKQIPIVVVSLLVTFTTLKLIIKLMEKPSNIPYVIGGYPFFGQMFVMLKGNPWDSMAKWVLEFGKVYKIHLFGSDMICVADPEILKVILSTKLSIFKKDLKWTYNPFLVILGNGLVTADGADHRKQRFVLLVCLYCVYTNTTFILISYRFILAKHFRTDILDFIPQMALEAFQRLTIKLNKIKSQKDFFLSPDHNTTKDKDKGDKNSSSSSSSNYGNSSHSKKLKTAGAGSGSIADYTQKGLFEGFNVIEMGEEFRHLTLQVYI